MKTSFTVARQARQAFFTLAIAAISLASCKDDKDNIKPDDGNPTTEDKGFLPNKDEVYTYRISDSDGSKSTSTMKVINVKDSSGISVYNIENEIQEGNVFVTTQTRAFSKGGVTTYEMAYEDAINALYTQVEDFAEIGKVTLKGFPHKQIMENKGTAGSNITFSKEPMEINLALKIPIDEDDFMDAEMDTKITYIDGKATKQETITTPAGTFNCSKWEYKYRMNMKLSSMYIPVEEEETLYQVELWTAPGIGIVKTVETADGEVSTTELQKISK